MKGLHTWPAVILLAGGLAGCGALGTPGLVPGTEEGGDESAEAPPTGAFAGRWTREMSDGGLMVFEVTDDGKVVHGERVEGGDVFASYTFDLEHTAEDALKGKASFTLEEDPDNTVETDWTAKLDGDRVVVQQGWVVMDMDTGEVVESGTEEVSYAFEAAAPPAAAAPPPAAGGMDPTSFVQAPGLLPVPVERLQVGYAVRQSIEASGQTMENWYAVVGEEEGAWRVEHVGASITAMAASFPELEGMIMGLVVGKEDGKVTHAVLGKPGEKGKEIKIGPVTEMSVQEQPELQGVAGDVTVQAGTFAARRYDIEDTTSWVGTRTPVEGVLLKYEGPQASYELVNLPRETEVEAGPTVVAARVLEYSNGSEYWLTPNDIVIAFFPWGGSPEGEEPTEGMLKLVSEGSTLNVTEVHSDAAPQLTWE